ncbi:MAG: hypothetical protein RL303_1431, partial [Verrucomicrobiota bacterium]
MRRAFSRGEASDRRRLTSGVGV